MIFSGEYKQKVYNCLWNYQGINTLMRYLEDNDDLSVRFMLEFILDSQKTLLDPHEIDEGDLGVYNGQVRYYQEIQSIYSEFMEELTKEIDISELENVSNINNIIKND